MSDEADDRDWEELNKRDRRRRALSMRRTREVVGALLVNPDGLRRLRDISDEQWQEAIDAERDQTP